MMMHVLVVCTIYFHSLVCIYLDDRLVLLLVCPKTKYIVGRYLHRLFTLSEFRKAYMCLCCLNSTAECQWWREELYLLTKTG